MANKPPSSHTLMAGYRVSDQLTRYYTAQGLTGCELAEAVNADLLRILDNTRLTRNNGAAIHVEKWDSIGVLFMWEDTAEGWDYWDARNEY